MKGAQMRSGGNLALIEAYLRLIRAAIDLGSDMNEALLVVPSDIRDKVHELLQKENERKLITFRRVVSLLREAGPRPWFETYDPAQGYHWRRLRNWLLIEKGYNTQVVESLDDSSDTILSHLENPSLKEPTKFRVQGLVLGRVQSGKTANYTALIAKAVDAGYKLVIVLAGIHNQLRWQTQQRLTEELGLSDSSVGVGTPEQGYRWSTITEPTYEGDFRPGSIQASILGELPVVAVCKKNATVLRRLLRWLKDRPKPAHLPVLIVDDEADQASINTGGNRENPIPDDELNDLIDLADEDVEGPTANLIEEIEPSTINKLVRSLVREFDRVCYIAYTATPFANVLIEPAGEDYEAGESLYPRDFIVSLPTPSEYIGAEQLFGQLPIDEQDGHHLDVISVVPELDAFYLNPTQDEEVQMTDSLKMALLDFVLSASAKDYREEKTGKYSPTTMLIHTSHRVHTQIEIGNQVRDEIRYLRNIWRYGSDEEEETRARFKERWQDEFQARNSETASLSFIDIQPFIDKLFRYTVPVSVFNSKTEDQLDYENDPCRKVIVIGGNRLSRGITLEGLIVSYFTRKSRNYDTIMQAGRWFGYRSGYADLTRLWTTAETYQYFSHLALVEEDLREQIEMFHQMNRSPLDVSPLILAHPDLYVTAPNRMGVGQEYHTSFAGQFLQSVRLPLHNIDLLKKNLENTKRFIAKLGPPSANNPIIKGAIWQDINWETLALYISSFNVQKGATNFRPNLLGDYIIRQAKESRELLRWWVGIIERRRLNSELGTIDLGETIGKVNAIGRSKLRVDNYSIGVLANPTNNKGNLGDDTIGLSEEQINRGRTAFENGEFNHYRTALRQQRKPTEGLLCIYPVSQYSASNRRNRVDLFNDPTKGVPVIGLAILFPPSKSAATQSGIGGPLAAEPT